MSRPGYIDKRGNARDRARRREWILETFDPDLGPGRARCALRIAVSVPCLEIVDAETLSVDRKTMGGTYARSNIQPACKPCQDRQGGLARIADLAELLLEYRIAREAWEVAFDLETGHTYRPGIIQRERRRERRGGRREITDFVDENPPPMFGDWLTEWNAARRDPDDQGGSWAPSTEDPWASTG